MTIEQIQALSGWDLTKVMAECIDALPKIKTCTIAAVKALSAAKIRKRHGHDDAEDAIDAAQIELLTCKEVAKMVREIKSSTQTLIRAIP